MGRCPAFSAASARSRIPAVTAPHDHDTLAHPFSDAFPG
jgi:hypothetical protein